MDVTRLRIVVGVCTGCQRRAVRRETGRYDKVVIDLAFQLPCSGVPQPHVPTVLELSAPAREHPSIRRDGEFIDPSFNWQGPYLLPAVGVPDSQASHDIHAGALIRFIGTCKPPPI